MITAAAAEVDVGMESYASGMEPCSAQARVSDEDFVVEENVELDGLRIEPASGYFPLYRVEKRSIDTMHMAEEMAEDLKSRVSYGGLKDKRASAVQFVTPTSLRSEHPRLVVRDRFTATLVGYVPRPLTRSAVKGNSFRIVLRHCCDGVGVAIQEAFSLAESRKVPNYYGLQRFGASGAGTHRIGSAIVREEFQEAVMLMLTRGGRSDDGMMRAVNEALETGDYEKIPDLLPPGMDVERRVARELCRRPGEWVSALRAVPLKLRRLYVQAYQSVLFNLSLSRALVKGEDISTLKPGDNWAEASPDGLAVGRPRGVRDPPSINAVPMVQVVGYAYRDYGSRFDAAIREVLQEENVAPRQFYVSQMQELSAEGGFRRPHLAVKDASFDLEGDTARLGFTLGKGQYATVLLREIIKPRDPRSAGLA